MKQQLQLKLSQSLTMTPQLQQAIRLLQLSTMELQDEVIQAVENNPMLELDEGLHSTEVGEKKSDDSEPLNEPNETFTQDELNELGGDIAVDSSWDDIYPVATPQMKGFDSDERLLESLNADEENIREKLLWQLNLVNFSETDEAIAKMLIDAVDDEGYLTISIEEVVEGLGIDDVEVEEVNAVLHLLQHFDPPGVFARNLEECLLLQLKLEHSKNPSSRLAQVILTQHLEELRQKDFRRIRKQLNPVVSDEEFDTAFSLIRSLTPNPGYDVAIPKTEFVIPDLKVSRNGSRWLVELNIDAIPKVKINQDYASLVRRADSSSDNVFLKSHLQEAKWFMKSLQSRNETLLRVATEIVERQKGFLEHGEVCMKPLVLHHIAESLGLHESTISRVTTHKYIHTPKGIYELKYFFSSHVGTQDGGVCSATAIRAIIKELVASENTGKPLSDSKIALLLKDRGINVARRTIAKYRESLRIPPSNERKITA